MYYLKSTQMKNLAKGVNKYMKKKIISAVICVLVTGSILAGCRLSGDYSGNWIATYTDETTGLENTKYVYMYGDHSLQVVETDTDGKENQYLGKWHVNDDKISLEISDLSNGTDDRFDSNGDIIEEGSCDETLEIVDVDNLTEGDIKYVRENNQTNETTSEE